MIEYTYEDANNVTYKSCLDYNTLIYDSFRCSSILSGIDPAVFGSNATATEESRQKVFAKLGAQDAHDTWSKLLSGRHVLCNAYENNQCLASCMFNLPASQVLRLSWTQQIKYYAAKAYAFFMDILNKINIFNPRSPFEDPAVQRFFARMYDEGTGPHDANYYAELATKSFDELKDSRYPLTDTLYVNTLCVRFSHQGKGLGPKLLNHGLSQFKLENMVFKSGKSLAQGPAKVSLFPSKGNEGFYIKLGFETVFRLADVRPSDSTPTEHLFMQRILKS